jgi:holliday junction DNA helicase RuvA
MIGKLTGMVDFVGEDHVLLEVCGIGYLVHCPSSTLSKMTVGANVSLITEMRLTDETIKLYGFVTAEEREWFRLLQTVQNVGARVALNVLSALSPRDLERALALGDKPAIGRAQGVGPKLALRIVTELKDKAPSMMLRGHGTDAGAPAIAPRGPEADAIAALVKLGYSQSTAAEAVARTARDLGEGAPLDALLREALRAMGR